MWRIRNSQSKYHNKTNVYNDEIYHSKAEAAYARELDFRLKANEIAGWERQVRVPLDVNGYHICNYIMDFVVTKNDGTQEYVEVKGFETEVWRLKRKLFEAVFLPLHPEAEYVVVKV